MFSGSFPDLGQHFRQSLGDDRTRFTANGVPTKMGSCTVERVAWVWGRGGSRTSRTAETLGTEKHQHDPCAGVLFDSPTDTK